MEIEYMKSTKKSSILTQKTNETDDYKQDLEQIKELLRQMNDLLLKLLDVLPFKK